MPVAKKRKKAPEKKITKIVYDEIMLEQAIKDIRVSIPLPIKKDDLLWCLANHHRMFAKKLLNEYNRDLLDAAVRKIWTDEFDTELGPITHNLY